MQDHIKRVVNEQRALEVKLNALSEFLYTSAFDSLDSEEKYLLSMQVAHMRGYNDVLKLRIKRESDESKFDAEQERYDNMVKP